jgi:DNA anti-recombination protein RmuC
MTDKKRTSISIDEDVYQFLQQSEVSQSGLINELVREYKNNDKKQVAALKLRHEHLIEEAEDLEDRAERKRDQAAEVEALIEEAEQQESEEMQQAREAIKEIPRRKFSESNPVVEHWADELDMTPTELINTVE